MEAALKQTPRRDLQTSPLEEETETGDLILR